MMDVITLAAIGLFSFFLIATLLTAVYYRKHPYQNTSKQVDDEEPVMLDTCPRCGSTINLATLHLCQENTLEL